jgi:non-specific serine/threonine protein kinase
MGNSAADRELIVIIQPGGGYSLDWQYVSNSLVKYHKDFQEGLYEGYLEDSDRALFMLGTAKQSRGFSDTLEYLQRIAAAYIKCLSRNPDLEVLRNKAQGVLEDEEQEELLKDVPFMNGSEYLDRYWLGCVWDRLNKVFSREMKEHKGTVAEYFISKNSDIHFAGKVYFHLVESKREEYPFAFLATYAAELSAIGRAKHLPLKNALMEYGQNSKKLLELLSTVNKAAQQSKFVSGLIKTGEIFHPIGLNADEAYVFLKEVSLYEEAGVLCRIPNWWRKKSESLKVSVNIGTKAPSKVGADALIDFNVALSLGGETITPEELRRLASESEGLVLIKGRWIEVDSERLKETLAAYEHAKKEAERGDLTMVEAMRMRLSGSKALNVKENACEIEINNGEWLENVIKNLKMPDAVLPASYGQDFRAVLREYQQRGVGWLHTMKMLGLGACLADDMGLGKTVQVIALLNNICMTKNEKVLLVVPASLIGNWTSEINKFAPSLKYNVIHPQEKRNTVDVAIDEGLYITTYGMLARLEWLIQAQWDMVILDEAQAIKNPGTKQTKTVKQLKTSTRIAMTGTPVENRLSDLWSIFDFLNKGLLGSAKEFDDFSKKLKESNSGYERLKQVVSPFILRRLKTDKSIIGDLPDKIEMKTYSALSKKQAALYSAVVKDMEQKLMSLEGI